MEDFPRTILEFEERFATEEARPYLAQLRWPEGFCCPRCGHRKAWITKRRLYHCCQCEIQTSVTAGTIRKAPAAVVPSHVVEELGRFGNSVLDAPAAGIVADNQLQRHLQIIVLVFPSATGSAKRSSPA